MVITRTPLRIGLVGGGSDIDSFARHHGGATLSMTIDRYVTVAAVSHSNGVSVVTPYEREDRAHAGTIQNGYLREALRTAGISTGIRLVTASDVPNGGTGLGTSSAVTVGALYAAFAFRGIEQPAEALSAMAARIEIETLGRPIGRQDQYACAIGGLNLFRFGPGARVTCEPVAVDRRWLDELERHLLIVYVGRRARPGGSLPTLGASLSNGSKAIHAELQDLRRRALDAAAEVRRGAGVEFLGEHLHAAWTFKRGFEESRSFDELDRLYERSRRVGALGGKILGAGAGGFFLALVPPARREAVRSVFRRFPELPARPESRGTRVLRSAET